MIRLAVDIAAFYASVLILAAAVAVQAARRRARGLVEDQPETDKHRP